MIRLWTNKVNQKTGSMLAARSRSLVFFNPSTTLAAMGIGTRLCEIFKFKKQTNVCIKYY